MRHNLSNLAYMHSTAVKFLSLAQFARTDVLVMLNAEFMPEGFFHSVHTCEAMIDPERRSCIQR